MNRLLHYFLNNGIKVILLAILFFKNEVCYSQITDQDQFDLKDIRDTYVADIIINKKAFESPCNCIGTEKSMCALYQGHIVSIHHLPEKTTVFSEDELKKISYFYFELDSTLNLNEKITVTLSPGTSKSFLVIGKVLKLKYGKAYKFKNANIYFSGLTTCYRLGFIDKLLLKLGLKKAERIDYSKKRRKKDKFEEYITSQ